MGFERVLKRENWKASVVSAFYIKPTAKDMADGKSFIYKYTANLWLSLIVQAVEGQWKRAKPSALLRAELIQAQMLPLLR